MSSPADLANGDRNQPLIALGLALCPGDREGVGIVESVRFWQLGQFVEMGVLEGVEASYEERQRSFLLWVRLRGIDREVQVYDSLGRLPRRWKSLDQMLKSLRSEGVAFERIRIIADISHPKPKEVLDEPAERIDKKPSSSSPEQQSSRAGRGPARRRAVPRGA
jgi:hypothetical protein